MQHIVWRSCCSSNVWVFQYIDLQMVCADQFFVGDDRKSGKRLCRGYDIGVARSAPNVWRRLFFCLFLRMAFVGNRLWGDGQQSVLERGTQLVLVERVSATHGVRINVANWDGLLGSQKMYPWKWTSFEAGMCVPLRVGKAHYFQTEVFEPDDTWLNVWLALEAQSRLSWPGFVVTPQRHKYCKANIGIEIYLIEYRKL